ncbi:hypothetical protein [Moraxella ovis]|uniref:hypothetical protein n=1 Tax=Moraxella ovis TaxID=29433 RepID=UPI000D96562F|nr:hypothetical protein [Moraxella ovis]SPX84494.1 Sulfonamide resistance protein [Moraxella ovis]STZ07060.1 Sulfonamide resistance protein [Moraxella ovis]
MSSPKNSELFLLLLLGVLSALGPFVMDLYLPSLPQLADFFATSTSMTQLTLTTAMLGLAVGQLFLIGLVLPAISALAMNSERRNAGSASALLGFAPFFLGVVVSPLVGIGDIFVATAVVMGVCAVLALGVYWGIKDRIENL